MCSTPVVRSAALLAIALTLSLSACGGDEAPAGSEGSSGGGSNASDTAGSVDVCEVVSAKDVGGVLGVSVEATPGGAGTCSYANPDAAGPGPLISVQEDAGGGLDSARVDTEGALSGSAEPIDVAGNEGYIVTGMVGEETVSQGAAAINGLIVSVTLIGGSAEDNVGVVTELLALTVGAL